MRSWTMMKMMIMTKMTVITMQITMRGALKVVAVIVPPMSSHNPFFFLFFVFNRPGSRLTVVATASTPIFLKFSRVLEGWEL